MNFMNKRSLLVPGSFPLRADSHCDTVIAEKNGCRSHIDFECMEQYCDLQFSHCIWKKKEIRLWR